MQIIYYYHLRNLYGLMKLLVLKKKHVLMIGCYRNHKMRVKHPN